MASGRRLRQRAKPVQDGHEVSGRVTSGLGEGSKFTALGWVRRQFRARLGFVPYPGTLNLEVRGAGWRALRQMLRREKGIPIVPAEGFCAAKCFRVILDDTLEGAAVFPDVPNYPPDKLEIIAPHPVRHRLGLKDRDRVRVRIMVKGKRG